MKRLALAVAAILVATGCGSSNSSPTTPTNPPTVFTVALKASNEVPAVSNAEANAAGTATITITTTKDSAGNITAGNVDFSVSMNSFPAGSTAILSHIHTGNSSVSGPVYVNTGLTAGTGIAMPNGTGSFTFNSIPLSADQASQILSAPQNFYFNVHTTLNPSGAIRGQLK